MDTRGITQYLQLTTRGWAQPLFQTNKYLLLGLCKGTVKESTHKQFLCGTGCVCLERSSNKTRQIVAYQNKHPSKFRKSTNNLQTMCLISFKLCRRIDRPWPTLLTTSIWVRPYFLIIVSHVMITKSERMRIDYIDYMCNVFSHWPRPFSPVLSSHLVTSRDSETTCQNFHIAWTFTGGCRDACQYRNHRRIYIYIYIYII